MVPFRAVAVVSGWFIGDTGLGPCAQPNPKHRLFLFGCTASAAGGRAADGIVGASRLDWPNRFNRIAVGPDRIVNRTACWLAATHLWYANDCSNQRVGIAQHGSMYRHCGCRRDHYAGASSCAVELCNFNGSYDRLVTRRRTGETLCSRNAWRGNWYCDFCDGRRELD